jgi:hypothetical protein
VPPLVAFSFKYTSISSMLRLARYRRLHWALQQERHAFSNGSRAILVCPVKSAM